MKDLFNWENPVMSFLTKLADLMILNVLTLLCCLPVITIGAAFSAMYYALLRMKTEKSSFVTKDFFHAFKMNFRQATIIWSLYLCAFLLLAIEYYFIFIVHFEMLVALRYAVYLFTALVLISLTWSFKLVSRYNDSIVRIIINSYMLGFSYIIRTLAMMTLMLVPVALFLLYPPAAPVILVMGLSLTGYLQTFLIGKVFEILEQTRNECANA